jgi:hypothetical protein
VLGTALAVFGVDALVRFGPSSLPRLEAVDAVRDVAVFSVILALACVAIFTLVPWLARGRAADGDLRESRRATAGRSRLWARHALVAFQFAMALVLLVGAGLIVRSFVALTSVDLGFEDRGVLTFRVVFPFRRSSAEGRPAAGSPRLSTTDWQSGWPRSRASRLPATVRACRCPTPVVRQVPASAVKIARRRKTLCQRRWCC